jgi:hypothetical protein
MRYLQAHENCSGSHIKLWCGASAISSQPGGYANPVEGGLPYSNCWENLLIHPYSALTYTNSQEILCNLMSPSSGTLRIGAFDDLRFILDEIEVPMNRKEQIWPEFPVKTLRAIGGRGLQYTRDSIRAWKIPVEYATASVFNQINDWYLAGEKVYITDPYSEATYPAVFKGKKVPLNKAYDTHPELRGGMIELEADYDERVITEWNPQMAEPVP